MFELQTHDATTVNELLISISLKLGCDTGDVRLIHRGKNITNKGEMTMGSFKVSFSDTFYILLDHTGGGKRAKASDSLSVGEPLAKITEKHIVMKARAESMCDGLKLTSPGCIAMLDDAKKLLTEENIIADAISVMGLADVERLLNFESNKTTAREGTVYAAEILSEFWPRFKHFKNTIEELKPLCDTVVSCWTYTFAKEFGKENGRISIEAFAKALSSRKKLITDELKKQETEQRNEAEIQRLVALRLLEIAPADVNMNVL